MFNSIRYSFQDGCVILSDASGNHPEPCCDISDWLREKCIQNGSTLQGRRQAFTSLTGQKKFVPVLVSRSPLVLLFPVSRADQDDGLWINYSEISAWQEKENKMMLTFRDGQELALDKPLRIRRSRESIEIFLLRLRAAEKAWLAR